MESLDDQKKILEIEKLKKEINTPSLYPSKRFIFWQLITPNLLTFGSIIVTAFILYYNNVFETKSTLLEIKKENLQYSIDHSTDSLKKLNKEKLDLTLLNSELSKKFQKLIYDLRTIDSIKKSDEGSLSDSKKQIAKLTIENATLLDSIQKNQQLNINLRQLINEIVKQPKEVEAPDLLTLSPNASRSVLNLKIVSEEKGEVKISVYDSNGKLVHSYGVLKTENAIMTPIGVGGLSNGVYTIQVNIANKKTIVTKFNVSN